MRIISNTLSKVRDLQAYSQLIRNNRNFAYLWLAQVVSLLGDWFNTIALSVLVAEYSGGSGLAISLFLMARFLPPLLFSPVAGVLVDRFDRQKILIYCNVLRTGVVLMFLFADSPDRLWLIYALTIVQFTLSALFEPGQSAITPSIVKRDDLVVANTLASITWSVMLALGAIIGGVVSALFGITTALIIDAGTFALAGFLISRIDVPPKQAHVKLDDVDRQESGSFWDGLRYMRRNPAVTAVLTVKGGGSLGNADTIMTVYATQLFIIAGSGQLSLGIMYSAYGLGAILGPLILNRFNDGSILRMRNLIIIGFIWSALGWFILGITATLWLVAFAFGVRAMGGSANWTYSSVIVQKSVPDQYLGRVFAMDLAIFQLVTVVSAVAHGFVIDALNAQVNFPLMEAQNAAIFNQGAALLSTPVIAQNLGLIAVGTGLFALLPLMFWLVMLPRIKRQEFIPAPAD